MIAFIHPASLDHRRRDGRHGRRPVDLVSGAGRTVAGAGEVDATRLDIATRVDGRVAEIPVERATSRREPKRSASSPLMLPMLK
jgi:hypothetical protein